MDNLSASRPMTYDELLTALVEANRKIKTRDALVKSQAECIERFRAFVRRYDKWQKAPWPDAGLLAPTVSEARRLIQPGDMGEAT